MGLKPVLKIEPPAARARSEIAIYFCSVQEGNNLSSRTVVIDAEVAFLRAGRIAFRDILLRTPKNRLVKSMARRHVREGDLGDRLRSRLAF